MAISRRKYLDKIYVYEDVDTTDANGRPKKKKQRIGEVVSGTDRVRYNEKYLDKLKARGEPLPADMYTGEARHALLPGGFNYVRKQVADVCGLTDVLQTAFPETYKLIFEAASALVDPQENVDDADDEAALFEPQKPWANHSLPPAVFDVASQIREDQVHAFFSEWCDEYDPDECTAYGILIPRSDTELAYSPVMSIGSLARIVSTWPSEILPPSVLEQFSPRLMIYDNDFEVPILEITAQGQPGPSTLRSSFSFRQNLQDTDVFLVLGEQSYSPENLTALLNATEPVEGFFLQLPLQADIAESIIDELAPVIAKPENAIGAPHPVTFDQQYTARIRCSALSTDTKPVYAYALYDAAEDDQLDAMRDDLIRSVEDAIDHLQASGDEDSPITELPFVTAEQTPWGPNFRIDHNALDRQMKTLGWALWLSDVELAPMHALDIVFKRTIVERTQIRNICSMMRNSPMFSLLALFPDEDMLTAAENSMTGLAFISFVSQVIAEEEELLFLRLFSLTGMERRQVVSMLNNAQRTGITPEVETILSLMSIPFPRS